MGIFKNYIFSVKGKTMSDIKEYILKLKKEIENKQKEVDNIGKLIELFPDLEAYTDRWKNKYFIAKSANSKVTRYYTKHNCGCCSDSPLEFWAYLETEYGKVYSNPSGVFIGQKSDYKDNIYSDWKEKLLGLNIPQNIIDAMELSFHLEDGDEWAVNNLG